MIRRLRQSFGILAALAFVGLNICSSPAATAQIAQVEKVSPPVAAAPAEPSVMVPVGEDSLPPILSVHEILSDNGPIAFFDFVSDQMTVVAYVNDEPQVMVRGEWIENVHVRYVPEEDSFRIDGNVNGRPVEAKVFVKKDGEFRGQLAIQASHPYGAEGLEIVFNETLSAADDERICRCLGHSQEYGCVNDNCDTAATCGPEGRKKTCKWTKKPKLISGGQVGEVEE